MPELASPTSAAPSKRPRGRPRKSVDERDDGNRRQDLLKAAAQLFRKKGFAATTTRDIAAAAGMQSGSPFYHFKSKDALLLAVMEAGMQAALDRLQTALQMPSHASLQPVEQLRVLVREHFEVLLGPGNDFVPVMLYESRSLNPRQYKQLQKLIAQYEALWMPVLLALEQSGHLRTPAPLAKLLILGALNWSVQWFDPHKSVSVAQLSDAAISLFTQEME